MGSSLVIKAGGVYSGKLATDIKDFKYNNKRRLAAGLAKKVAHFIPVSADGLVPVPMHAALKRQRGYNHSKVLADELAKITGVPVKDVLVKSKANKLNVRLGVFARAHNVRGAFRVSKRYNVRGLKLVIVDDMVLSGSTLDEAARALRAAGVGSVRAVVVARSKRAAEVKKRFKAVAKKRS